MANLSNINNILRTSSLGIGINCDAEFSLDIEKASANAILSLNSNGGSGAEYLLSSTTSGEFVLNKRYVGDRLTISSGGDATFAGNVLLNGYLSVEGTTGNTGGATDRWIGGDGTAGTWFYNVPTGSSHLFGINNSNVLTLNGTGATFAGRVKINSTAAYKLNVEDSASFLFYGATDATTGSVFRLRSNNKAVTIVDIDAAGNSTFAGNVGINTASTAAILTVTGAVADDWAGRFENTSTDGFGILAKINSTSSGDYIFQARTGTTNVMTILGDGNVGIGTTSPDGKLQVTAASSTTSNGNDASSKLYLTNTDTTNNNYSLINFTDSDGGASSGAMGLQYTDHTNNYGDLCFITRGSGGYGERMRIDSSGNVGIGQSPVSGARLTLGTGAVANEILSFAPASAGNAEIRSTTSTGTFTFTNSNGATELMRIRSGGVVQINTNAAKTSTSTAEFASFGQSNEATNYSTLQMYTIGGASQADRSVIFQTIESGVANAGNIVLQRSGGNVGIGGGTIEGKLSIDYTAAELPTSGTTSNSAIQVTSSLNNQLNLGLNTVSGSYGAYIQASDNNLAVPYPLNLQPNGGNVGIGTSSPSAKFQVNGEGLQGMQAWFGNGFINNANYHYSFTKVGFSNTDPTGTETGAGFQFNTRNSSNGNWMHGYIYQPQDGGIAFGTGGAGTIQATERMRITSAGTTEFKRNVDILSDQNTNMFKVRSTSGSFTSSVLLVDCDRTTTNNTYNLAAFTNAGTAKCVITDGGDLKNTNNSYGAISDERLKENITDATPKLDDLMKVKVRNFNMIGDDKKQIGVVAQELEEVFPNMIDESIDYEYKNIEDEDGNTTEQNIDLGTTTKSVKYSVFVPMLIKAIQELKAEIEILKNK